MSLARRGKVEPVKMPRTVKRRRTVTDNSGGKSSESLPGHEIINQVTRKEKMNDYIPDWMPVGLNSEDYERD